MGNPLPFEQFADCCFHSLQQLPASVELEANLRNHEVDGCVLLCDFNEKVIKQDLGLTKLSWRSFLNSALETLRLRSEKYNQHMLFQQTGSYFPSRESAIQRLGLQQPNRVLLTPLPNPPSRSARGEFIMSDEHGNKRRKLDLTTATSNLALRDEDDEDREDHGMYAIQESDHAETPQPENKIMTPTPDPADFNGKKRKRIAPTLVSSEIDPNRIRELPTAADNVVHNDPQKIEPGVLFRGEDGRKRLVPVHQPNGDSEESYNYQALLQKPDAPAFQALVKFGVKSLNSGPVSPESLAVGYLGKKKLVVDDIFYKETPIGQELLTEVLEGFCVAPKTISSGRRIYVHRVMKKFLNSERVIVVRDGRYFSGVRPYPSTLVPRYHKASFTLFYASETGQILARREALQSWPEIDPEALSQKPKIDIDGKTVTFNTSGAWMLDAIGSNDPFDPANLEKYNYIEGGDEVLPIYGESGQLFGAAQLFQTKWLVTYSVAIDEENEYDIETWREIEEEQGTVDRPIQQLTKPSLSVEEVYEAVDEGIAEIASKWAKQKLPTKQRKAFRIWKKYHPRLLNAERVRVRQSELEHIRQRIANLRKEIGEELWPSKAKVLKQARILEPSVYDREELIWELRLLQSKQRPKKVSHSKYL